MRKKITFLVLAVTVCILTFGCAQKRAKFGDTQKRGFSIGLVADVQYADREPVEAYNCFYRQSPGKLADCVRVFNEAELDFVIQLGDFVDKDLASYEVVKPIWNEIKHDKYHVIGNHDLQETADYATIFKTLGLSNGYYSFSVKGWRFIVIDTSEISLYSHAKGTPEYEEALAINNNLKERQVRNSSQWAGMVGDQQLEWLSQQLGAADKAGEKVIVFGHHPIISSYEPAFTAWNGEKIVDSLESHVSFKAYICGHDHKGDYVNHNGRHYLTMESMLWKPEVTAFGILHLSENNLTLKGYGRTANRIMPLF
jgi:3',5'-cyclic AMP phosphodiesterase CpdA